MIDIFGKLTADEKLKATQLLKQTGSSRVDEADAAQRELAAELSTPLRQGVLDGDIIGGIFQPSMFDVNARTDYPIDLFRPDNDGEFVAFTIPNQGRIPERHVVGDYVTVPTYDIGAGIDFLLRFAREARWDVVARALEVLEAGFTKKLNDDGWHTLLAAAVDRNILVSDSNATAGQFTKRLVSLMKLVMRRNSGGNSTSTNRGKLTHLYLSPEAIEDMRNWGLDEVDDVTRREIYNADDGSLNRVFNVNMVDIDEFGASQEYQNYFTNTLSGTMGSSDTEIAIGVDLGSNDSFVMPVREALEVFPDPALHRQRRQGYYAWMSAGFGVLDNRRILLGSL